MSLRLIIEDDEGSTTVVPLGAEAITIGRQQGNTIQLTEKNVSRRHARLFPDAEKWVIEDLGSYNGVKVNGRPVDGRVLLNEGDVVQIGDYHLALTEDVDRRALNYDRQRAANDVEPMLASSSTNLPRLSPEEIAALSSSGQQPVAQPIPTVSPTAMFDSGQMPLSRGVPLTDDRPKRTGVLVALGLVLIGGIALGGFWIAQSSGDKKGTEIAKADGTPAAAAKPEASKPTPAVPPLAAKADAKQPEPPDAKIEPPVVPANPPPDPIPSDSGDTPSTDDGEVEVEPDTADEPKVNPRKPESRKPDATKKPPPPDQPKKPPPPTPTKPPPAPAVDAAALMADARAAKFAGRFGEAYDLASKAYAAKHSADAAAMMALAACKMGDTGKAKRAIGKLKGAQRQDAISTCADNGVNVE